MKLKNIFDENLIRANKSKEKFYETHGIVVSDIEDNLFESYSILTELLNTNNAYKYDKIGNYIWKYTDVSGNDLYVRYAYQPMNKPYFELKTFWKDSNGKTMYSDVPQGSTAQDWDKRSDTLAKIFRDEVLPLFKKQSEIQDLVFLPITRSRYYFSLRLIKKFVNGMEIIEEYPKKIIIRKEI